MPHADVGAEDDQKVSACVSAACVSVEIVRCLGAVNKSTSRVWFLQGIDTKTHDQRVWNKATDFGILVSVSPRFGCRVWISRRFGDTIGKQSDSMTQLDTRLFTTCQTASNTFWWFINYIWLLVNFVQYFVIIYVKHKYNK